MLLPHRVLAGRTHLDQSCSYGIADCCSVNHRADGQPHLHLLGVVPIPIGEAMHRHELLGAMRAPRQTQAEDRAAMLGCSSRGLPVLQDQTLLDGLSQLLSPDVQPRAIVYAQRPVNLPTCHMIREVENFLEASSCLVHLAVHRKVQPLVSTVSPLG